MKKKKCHDRTFKRGEVWWANIGFDCIGSEQGGRRPVVIIQNDVGNRFSPTVIVAMSTAQDKNTMPTHYEIRLFEPSTIMLEQLRTIDKRRLTTKIRDLTPAEISEINKRLKISLELE